MTSRSSRVFSRKCASLVDVTSVIDRHTDRSTSSSLPPSLTTSLPPSLPHHLPPSLPPSPSLLLFSSQTHFEGNPRDLQVLRHDKVLQPTRVQPHLKHIPSYLRKWRRGGGREEGRNWGRCEGRDGGRHGGTEGGRGIEEGTEVWRIKLSSWLLDL